MTTSEVDLVVKYANEKGGGPDGSLVIDDVELERSRDNRVRHGIGHEEPQSIERGNNTYTFSTTCFMNDAAARAMKRIHDGKATADTVYIREEGTFTETADGMMTNTVNTSASDDGDTTVQIDADLMGLTMRKA
jgi:hypothetical protein